MALALALGIGACRGPRAPEWRSAAPLAVGRGAPGGEWALWREVAALEAEKRLDEARTRLSEALVALPEEAPRRLDLAFRLQDLEERALEAGLAVGFAAEGGEPAARALRRAYAERAQRSASAGDWVLAARAEEDDLAALHLLGRALELEPELTWAHVGRAHVLARLGRLEEAAESLDRALALDPDHLIGRRLEVRLLQRQGRARTALVHLEAWLERSAHDPRVAPEALLEAELDAALLALAAGQERAALARLEAVGPLDGPAGLRRELLRAAALEARGRPAEALEATRRARELGPEEHLPRLYEALLLEEHLGDRAGAARAWRELLEAIQGAEGELDLPAALAVLRARVALAGLEPEAGR